MSQTFSNLTLILGGARSGKSTYAQKMAEQQAERVLYVATAEAGDDEMAERIAVHRDSRPHHWVTLEAPQQVGAAVLERTNDFQPEVILLDCLTLLTSNLILTLPEADLFTGAQSVVNQELEGLMAAYQTLQIPWIIVSNEVGLDLVPPYPLGRVYRDVLGWANQYLALRANRVVFMIAGIAMQIKG